MVKRRPASDRYGADWNLVINNDGTYTTERVEAILLQEIRDELKRLNALLHCKNFLTIPTTLRAINKQCVRIGRK